MAFLEVYSFGREIMQNRQYYNVSGIAFWKCTPLLRTPFFCLCFNMAFLEVYSFGREIMENTLIWISNQIMPNHQFYIVENEVYSIININTCLIPKILSIMYGGVHFQDCYNRDGGYCSNMIIMCRVSMFTVYYIVKK